MFAQLGDKDLTVSGAAVLVAGAPDAVSELVARPTEFDVAAADRAVFAAILSNWHKVVPRHQFALVTNGAFAGRAHLAGKGTPAVAESNPDFAQQLIVADFRHFETVNRDVFRHGSLPMNNAARGFAEEAAGCRN